MRRATHSRPLISLPPFAVPTVMPKPHVMIVDDDPVAVRVITKVLGDEATVCVATNGLEAVELARTANPDLVLLDAELPGLGGFDVCRRIKAMLELAHVPVMIVTSHRDEAFELEGFDAGASDFVTKPVNHQLLRVRIRSHLRVKWMADELVSSARTDQLTTIANRRRFDEVLVSEWSRAHRSSEALSIILLDVDYFKRFNDSYGHVAGDECLRRVATTLRDACLRPGDLVARYGGEEFGVILPETPVAGAVCVAKRMLEAVTLLALPHSASMAAPFVTMSAGIASYSPQQEYPPSRRVTSGEVNVSQVGQLVADADAALYAAKAAGRARYVAHGVAEQGTRAQ